MIELVNVSKTFSVGQQQISALDDVNLTVPAGCIMGVIGSSGAGKSTLIRCVNGLESVTTGSVVVDGTDLTALGEKGLRLARRDIGMIFQHFNLLSSRTVYDNIAFPLELQGASTEEIKAAVEPLLTLTGLSAKTSQYPSQLSGGQKQRVAIARALAAKPKVLLCDEATSALDPHTTQSILALLRDINRELGITILLITHEMEVVKSVCDRVAIISDGRIVEENDVPSFFVHPKTDLAREFVKSALHEKLPEAIEAKLQRASSGDDEPIIRISFLGGNASTPLISQVSRDCEVDLSIMQSSLELLNGQTMGFLTAQLSGTDDNVSRAIRRLKDEANVTVEVLGYVV
ncbi:MAG: methionine ABC transporter ATP-binding protein [Pseudomonadales bacterium]|jgi:D-methionine transport system ATP-binding protein